MYKSVEIINLEQHKNIAVKELASVDFAKNMISAPLGFPEFYEACRDYPIFFAKDPEGQWFATALFGYQDENLFVDDEGKWKAGRYIPAFFRRYPFILARTDDENFSLAFDSVCGEELNDSNGVRAFFDREGNPSEFTKNAFKFLFEIQNEAVATEGLIKDLENWGLLEEKSAQMVAPDGTAHVINGFFTVNEQKLVELSEEKRVEIYKKGAIPLITAHLISLGNIQRLTLKL